MCKIDKDGEFCPRPPLLFRVIYIEHVAVYFLKLILNRFISYIMDRKKILFFNYSIFMLTNKCRKKPFYKNREILDEWNNKG